MKSGNKNLENEYKIYNILGIKVKIKNRKQIIDNKISNLQKQLNDAFNKSEFMYRRIQNNSKQIIQAYSNIIRITQSSKPRVLVFEPNFDAHSEVVPGYVKYFLDLGCQVDVLMLQSNYDLGALDRIKDDNLHIFTIEMETINDFFSISEIFLYNKIILTSHIVYWANFDRKIYENIKYTERSAFVIDSKEQDIPIESAFVCYPALLEHYDKISVVEHHLENCPRKLLDDKKVISLSEVAITKRMDVIIANPHYYGEVKYSCKTENFTNFIMIGGLHAFRKNTNILLIALKKLVANGIKNFKITVIGYGELTGCDDNIKDFFDIKGRINYPEMYECLENADFILPLFDPNNKDHNRYIERGTSGIFQLIYGFRKPCIIHNKFASVHRLNKSNSIIYTNNSDLASKMEDCINMSSKEYNTYVQNLGETANDIYKKGKANLDKFVLNCERFKEYETSI